ncbi:hypothetical protein [Gulosibacter molinativorax]|uniref:hypothetical protein n=1 Tax=Gulosibacter molinativorax TaxID=256821 RepID=UPI00040F68FD|nr:hypothetical protein [Gulosibacter molinativorax]QUY63330.1 Hypotetical protein [Gulosibacter molinativorax]
MTSERISDERLAELRALQEKRIKGRGGVPEVRDLAKALTELAELRERDKRKVEIVIDEPRCRACGLPKY